MVFWGLVFLCGSLVDARQTRVRIDESKTKQDVKSDVVS